MNVPKVTVIVPNWNGQQWLPGCMWALGRQRYASIEAIVVDNHSGDRSREIFECASAASPHIDWKWVGLDRNYGFGVAVNRALETAKGTWIALLNNDAAPMPDWISELINAVDSEEIGMVACKTYLMTQPAKLDKCGHLMYPDGLNRGRGSGQIDANRYADEKEVLFPDGAAGLYRKSMLDQIGGMDEALFAYGDDSEMGMRGLWAGWRCVYAPRAVAYHWRSATAGAYSPQKAYWVERNRIWLKWKLFPWPLLITAPAFTLLRYAYQSLGTASGVGAAGQFRRQNGAVSLASALFRAHWSALLGMGRILRERKAIMSEKNRTTLEMTRLLWKHRISAKELSLGD